MVKEADDEAEYDEDKECADYEPVEKKKDGKKDMEAKQEDMEAVEGCMENKGYDNVCVDEIMEVMEQAMEDEDEETEFEDEEGEFDPEDKDADDEDDEDYDDEEDFEDDKEDEETE